MRRVTGGGLLRKPRQALLLVGAAGGLAVVAAGGFAIGAKSFSSARAGAKAKLAADLGRIEQIEKARAASPTLKREFDGIVERTLGPDLTTTDSVLRSRLNRIGEEIRLADLRVSTGTVTKRVTPAKRALAKPKDPRELDDFVELPATVTGSGTLEQALALVHRIDVEPWIKRIDGVSLDEEREGQRIKVVVRLTTIYVPDRKGNPDLRPNEAELASFERMRAVIDANPFQLPSPKRDEPAPVATAQPQPPPPAGFAYDQWRVTALVTGPLGPEAWLRNATTGEQRQLMPGQSIGDASFVGFVGDIAEFRVGDARFRIQVGGALSDRQPA